MPSSVPSSRGGAAPILASGPRTPSLFLGLLAGHDRPADEGLRPRGGAAPAAGAGRDASRAAGRVHSSSATSASEARIRPPSQAGADPVPRVAGSVVDPRAGWCGRRADGRRKRRSTGPTPVRPGRHEARTAGAAACLGPRGRRLVAREAVVETAAEADRPASAAHQHASVVRRPEVVEEHPPVDDRLAADPADLGEQLRRRLGEDDVGAEVRQVPARPGSSRSAPRWSRARPWERAGCRRASSSSFGEPARSPVTGVSSCMRDAGVEGRPPQPPHEQARVDGCALGVEDATPEDRRARCAAVDLVRRQQQRPDPHAPPAQPRGPPPSRRRRPAPARRRPRASRPRAARHPPREPRPRRVSRG